MVDYNEYLRELKGLKADIDYDKNYGSIKGKLAARPSPLFLKTVFPLAGALAVLLIAFALFYNLKIGAGSDTIAGYLEEGQSINGSPLMTYVFGD